MAGKTPTTTAPEGDYGAIETAVMETARGRWFLSEFARRYRSSDTEAVLDAIARLESATTPSVPAELARQIDELHQYLTTLRGSGDDARPPHARPVQAAENAMAAIRRTTDKIREVAFELRETARLGIYAEALDLYCHDLISAVGFQETSTRQLTDLAALLGSVEARVVALADAAHDAGAEELEVRPVVVLPKAAVTIDAPVAVTAVPPALPRAELPPAPPALLASTNGHGEKRSEPLPVVSPPPAQPAAAVAVGGSGRAFLSSARAVERNSIPLTALVVWLP